MPHGSRRVRTVTIFGSGAPGLPAEQYETARRLGAELAGRGFRICNGGYGGTMEAAARGAREQGGKTFGVTLRGRGWADPNPYLDEVAPQPDLPARIVHLLESGDGYVVLAGGTGTLAEIGLMLELHNKGFIPVRPIVFLGKFWQPLLELLAGESMFRQRTRFGPVEGIDMVGPVACTGSPETAARYLEANLL